MQLKNYVEVHDEDLLKRLENVDGYPSYVVEGIRNKFLFKKIYEKPIKEENFDMSEKFLHYVTNSKKEQISSLSDEISIKLCESLNVERYNIICDITKSRTPGDIYLDTYTENNEPYDARSRSDILPAIKQKIDLKIYVKPSLKEKMTEDLLNPLINDLLSAW